MAFLPHNQARSARLTEMDREISPPPLKRRKVQTADITEHQDAPHAPGGVLGPKTMITAPTRCIRLFSWNINGVQPFLPASNASITSYFKPVSPKERREGASLFQESTEFQTSLQGIPLRAFLQRHRWPEVVLLQELKISPIDKKTPLTLLSAVNTSLGKQDAPTPENRYTLDVNLPRDKYNARGFGGRLYGVGTLLREDFASQHVANIRHAGWDLEGRVTIVELRPGQTDIVRTDPQVVGDATHVQRGADKPLALVNIYAVNGTTAPYRSPETGKVVGTRHDHKLAVHTRLCDECLSLESRGFSVVVAGDLNIARGTMDGHPSLRTYPRQHCVNRADFNAKFFGDEDIARAEAYTGNGSRKESEAKFDGVDVFRALRGKERRYTYHPTDGDNWGSSCDRVDLIIVSKALLDAGRVVDTDILDSPQERGTSDHVPLWVKIRLDRVVSGKEDSPHLGEGIELP